MLLFTVPVCFGQYNLVPNASFEIYAICPTGSHLEYATPWENPLYPSTPDYCNACDTTLTVSVPSNGFGYELAHSGVAYARIITFATNQLNPTFNHWREYVEVELSDSLLAGVDYCIQFYVSSVDSTKYFANDMGLYFSNQVVKDTCPGQLPCNLSYIPQFENSNSNSLDKDSGWTLISGSYIATGGEKYVVIGNFKDSASTTAVYKGYGQWNFAMYYIDDVLITPCDSLTAINNVESYNISVQLFPNPSDGKISIKVPGINEKTVRVFNCQGQLIGTFYFEKTIKVSVDISSYPSGFYFLEIEEKNKIYKSKIVKL